MGALYRILACLLEIPSPSLMVCPRPVDRSWLDRWERRVQDKHRAIARTLPSYEWRDEVQIVDPISRTVRRSIDVTGRSDRAMRRVRNKWRRRAAGEFEVQIKEEQRLKPSLPS